MRVSPRVLLATVVLLAGPSGREGAAAQPASSPASEAQLNLEVSSPGAYRVPFEELAAAARAGDRARYPSSGVRILHLGEPVPLWVEDGGDGELGPGDALEFAALRDRLWPPGAERDGGLAVLRLELDAPARGSQAPGAAAGQAEGAPPAPLRSRRVFEEDRIRAPVTRAALAAELESLWMWAPISHLASSSFELDLGDLRDLAPAGHEDFEIRVGLLGWSEADGAKGIGMRTVRASVGGLPVGEARWDGRSARELRVRGVPAESLSSAGPGGPRLELRIAARLDPESGEPRIDLVYVDRVEIRYRVAGLPRGADALLLAARSGPRRLLDPSARLGERLFSDRGWTLSPEPGVGWLVPPPPEPGGEEELILGGPGSWRSVRRLAAVAPPEPVPESIDYLMIAPPALHEAAEPLADAHRRRGLRVAIASTAGIFDHHGHGYASVEALRAFVDRVSERSPDLRYLLLVGDADWFRPPRPPVAAADSDRDDSRGPIPTSTVFAQSGPAASDHPLVREAPGSARPRFAVGRLPVADSSELERVVRKTLARLEPREKRPPEDSAPARVLLVSDRSAPSLGRAARSEERLQAAAAIERTSLEGPDFNSELLAALDRAPSIVHFNGHGSRHSWQLGASHSLGPAAFFDREDVEKLAPRRLLPVVLSASCSTAPFDHPSAGSLGEAMLLSGDRGAVAFIGATARLYTMPRFGESLVRRLLAGESVGDALMAVESELDHPEISSLYTLLGDPALTLFP
ncbi:MAG: C25 family cysteine peptidase [Acidobacteriota bacterium]